MLQKRLTFPSILPIEIDAIKSMSCEKFVAQKYGKER